MLRKDARALAKATLEGLDLYQTVFSGPARKFGGVSPVATLYSAALELQLTRGGGHPSLITLSIYKVYPEGEEEATEDAFDDLVLASLTALKAAGFTLVNPTTAAPGGAPLRLIDGKLYRAEQMTLRKL